MATTNVEPPILALGEEATVAFWFTGWRTGFSHALVGTQVATMERALEIADEAIERLIDNPVAQQKIRELIYAELMTLGILTDLGRFPE